MFDRSKVKLIREVVQNELDKLGEKLKLKFNLGSASFTSNNIHFKMEVAGFGEDGKAVTSEMEMFKRYAMMYGLKPDDLGKQFNSWNGNTYTITGLSTRRSKYPIHAEKDGKKFKFPADEVKYSLEKREKDSSDFGWH